MAAYCRWRPLLEKLGFGQLVEETLTIGRLTRAMPVYRFVLAMVLALYVGCAKPVLRCEKRRKRRSQNDPERLAALRKSSVAIDAIRSSRRSPDAAPWK
jgi:hypothetical protein